MGFGYCRLLTVSTGRFVRRSSCRRTLAAAISSIFAAVVLASSCSSRYARRIEQPECSQESSQQQDSSQRVFQSLMMGPNWTVHHHMVHFSEAERTRLKSTVRHMFYHGYDNYMQHAYPLDELDPLACTGRGSDRANPDNLNINDVLGDYSLTLIDALDTLAVLGDENRFKEAVRLVVNHVHFHINSTVQVFEANIRVLGALLSAHLLIVDERRPFGDLRRRLYELDDVSPDSGGPSDYDGELLDLAHDLGTRLLSAFQVEPVDSSSTTGLPFPRINLMSGGVPADGISDTCTAGAGSLVLEFGLLSRLTGDPIFEWHARNAADELWNRRSEDTGLTGSTIDVRSGQWTSRLSGLGAGIDSFYEYLLKSYILFGEKRDLDRFDKIYANIKLFMRRGRSKCNSGQGHHPFFVNVDMQNGNTINTWLDSLQAAFPSVQLLAGDLDEAVCFHAVFYALWKRYGALPERYDWKHHSASVLFYPLRPEFAESTYFLYQATKNPFYLHVGREIVISLEQYARAVCGYATIHNVLDKSQLEDRMESFFLSETCKYLYLLFDERNFINRNPMYYVFSTEGHLFPVKYGRMRPIWDHADSSSSSSSSSSSHSENGNISTTVCEQMSPLNRWSLPLSANYLDQLMAEFHVYS